MRAEMGDGDTAALQDELGDLLFSAVNLARLLGMDAEQTLSRANEKFERRFRAMERDIRQRGGTDLHALSAQAWDEAWEAAKRLESEPGAT